MLCDAEDVIKNCATKTIFKSTIEINSTSKTHNNWLSPPYLQILSHL